MYRRDATCDSIPAPRGRAFRGAACSVLDALATCSGAEGERTVDIYRNRVVLDLRLGGEGRYRLVVGTWYWGGDCEGKRREMGWAGAVRQASAWDSLEIETPEGLEIGNGEMAR